MPCPPCKSDCSSGRALHYHEVTRVKKFEMFSNETVRVSETSVLGVFTLIVLSLNTALSSVPAALSSKERRRVLVKFLTDVSVDR